MPSQVQFSIRDYSDEVSNVEFILVQGTAGNFDTLVGYKDAIRTALAGIMLGNIDYERFIAQRNDVDNGPAQTSIAQRELKWVLTFTDDVTGGKFSREIPCADVSNADLFNGNSDIADLSATEWVAFKAAVDGIVRNFQTGNTATLTSAVLRGRNI